MALKVAPEQGWGTHWNEFHPSNPFTPIEVGPTGAPIAPVPSSAQAGTVATPPAGFSAHTMGSAPAAPASFSAHTVVSAPAGFSGHTVSAPPAAADVVAAINFGQMNATASVNPTYFAIGGSQGGSSGSGDHPLDDQGTLKLSFYGDEWLIVPSFANETGTSYAGYDDGAWDLAGWNLSSDWFLV